MKLLSLFLVTTAVLFVLNNSLAGMPYDCSMMNKTGWPVAFYLGDGDVINLQNREVTQFSCRDLKGVVANQVQALDGRALMLHQLGDKRYAVTANEPPYPH